MENPANIINTIAKNVKATEDTYIGEDGLKYCSVCHEPVQHIIHSKFLGDKIVPVVCKCLIAGEEAARIEAVKKQHERNRRDCFRKSAMFDMTFDNDDRATPRLSDFCAKYVENFDKHIKDGKGILFTGGVGTGKSYMAACIANAVIDKGYTALFTSLPELCRTLGNEFDGSKQENLDRLDRYSLLILDDLGIERDTPYMLENVFSIIDGRYRCGKPMIVTTNLGIDEIRNCEELKYKRIYDRIIGQSFVASVSGGSRRAKRSDELQQEAIEIMRF